MSLINKDWFLQIQTLTVRIMTEPLPQGTPPDVPNKKKQQQQTSASGGWRG